MNSLIFATAARFIMPVLLLLSIFILFRGHNEPGGGFIGGLAAASAFAMYVIAFDVHAAREMLRIHPIQLIGWGLLVAFGGGAIAILNGLPFMTGVWTEIELPVIGKLGSPLLFDVGVYLVVIGISLLIIFTLAEDD